MYVLLPALNPVFIMEECALRLVCCVQIWGEHLKQKHSSKSVINQIFFAYSTVHLPPPSSLKSFQTELQGQNQTLGLSCISLLFFSWGVGGWQLVLQRKQHIDCKKHS